MTLHLICDISGSMSEGGKPFSVRTMVMTVVQWVRLGYVSAEIRLYGWASEIRPVLDWGTKDEFPAQLLSCRGATNGAALIEWLGKTPDGKFIVFTDGFWTRDPARLLQQVRESLPQGSLRIIKIGADANPRLKGPDVFAPEDLFLALDDWSESGAA